MKRLARIAPALALATCALVSARAEPPAPLRLENLVPGTSLAFASLEDVGTWGSRWERTGLGKLLAEPEMKAFLEPAVEDLRRAAEGRETGKPLLPGTLVRLLEALAGLRGQAAACLVDLADGERPVFAAALDFGEKVSDFTTFLERLGGEDGKVPMKREEAGGRTWWILGEVGEEPPVSVTVLGASVVASTDRAWLEGVVASGGAAVPQALAESAAFRDSKETVGGSALAAFVWANVPSILQRVRMSEKDRAVANGLGLDTVRAAAYGLAFRGDGFADTLHVSAPGADHGYPALMRSGPSSHRALAWAPATAFLYEDASSAQDPAAVMPKWREMMARIDPRVAREFDEFFRKAREASGVDLEKDLLGGLSGEVAVWMGFPETGGVYPEAAYLLALKDPASFESVFERGVNGLASWLGREKRVRAVQRTIEYRGKRLHVLDLSASRGKDVVPFTPTWAILDGWLVATLVPHAMKELILRREAGTPGLAGEEDVKAILAAAPPGHGTFLYVDTQAALNLLYDTGVPLLQAAAKPNVLGVPVRLDWAQLPAARTVRPHLRSLAAFLTADDRGITLSAQSPTGVLLPLAIVAAVAIPQMVKPARRAQATRAQAHLVELSSAIQLHVLKKRALPRSLEELTQIDETGEPLLERLPTDPWGRPYGYRIVDERTREYELWSNGPDLAPGTGDEVFLNSKTDR